MSAVKGLPISVRIARSDELPVCAALATQVARASFTWNAPDIYTEKEFLEAATEEEIFVAVVDARIVGVLAFYRPENFLHTLAVAPDARSQGAGTALIEAVRGSAEGALTLKVEVPNFSAISYYERHGWRRVTGADGEGVNAHGVRWRRYRFM